MSTHNTKLTLTTTGLFALLAFGAGAQSVPTTHNNASSSTRHIRHHRRIVAAKRGTSRTLTVYHYNPKANGGFTTYKLPITHKSKVAKQMAQPAGPDDTQVSVLPESSSASNATRRANASTNASRAINQQNSNYAYTAAGAGPMLYVAPSSPYLYGGTSITPSIIDLSAPYAYGYGLNGPVVIGNNGPQYFGDYNGSNGVTSSGYNNANVAPNGGVPVVAPPGAPGSPSAPVVAPNATVVNPPAGTGVYENNGAAGADGVQNGNSAPNGQTPNSATANMLPASSVVTTSLESGNRLRMHWIGPTNGLARSTFMMLDSNRRVVRSKTVVGPPTEVLFPRSSRYVYYGVRLYFNNGSTRTLISAF